MVIAVEYWVESAYYYAMIKLNIRSLAAAAGIANPLVFSRQSGLAYAMCYKLWNDQQTRIDLSTIDRLCEVLRCSPGELFIREAPAVGKQADAPTTKESAVGKPGLSTVSGSCRRIRWID